MSRQKRRNIKDLGELAFIELVEEIQHLYLTGKYWIELEKEEFLFNIKIDAIFPNFYNENVEIPQSSIKKFYNRKVIDSYYGKGGFELMTSSECRDGFLTSTLNKGYYRNRKFLLTDYIVVRGKYNQEVVFDGYGEKYFSPKNNIEGQAMYITRKNLGIEMRGTNDAIQIAIVLLRNNLIPKVSIVHYEELKKLFKEYTEEIVTIYNNGKIQRKDTKRLADEEKTVELSAGKIIADKINITEKEKSLLECDRNRFNYLTYEKDRLYDLLNGHWDLYDASIADGRDIYKTEEGYVARNPLLDVHRNGVVAIDFGTKSTVVVYKNGTTMKVPMRIGTTKLNKEVSDNQYENPTVEEFISIPKFLEKYNEKAGRPDTKWGDLIIANMAQKDMLDNGSVLDNYYSFFADIKQWAAGQTEAIILDQSGYMPQIKALGDESTEIDLVEIYAYFIGMHINNMRNGIFLNYKLSYPVSFDSKVRENIRKSFEKGIKKSIPEIVQQDTKFLKKFKVRLLASEPEAYVSCAIQEYGLDTSDENPLFYGVFDFGGGTSDFDFGWWKEYDDEDSHYTYELQRITSVGDTFLGGENLLLLLAYEVFKQNAGILQKNNIVFTRPIFCERFKGDETIVVCPSTRISQRNMYVMKEKLREFWESDYVNFLDKEDNICIELITADGIKKNNIQLKVNYSNLYNLLESRIHEGINQFENGRQIALNRLDKASRDSLNLKKQHIFMSGNSCKSSIVRNLMQEKYGKEIEEGKIELHLPLGEIQREEENDLFHPNGKTGVAWGLLDIGDSIKFTDNELAEEGKIEFKYYIGINRRGKFKLKINPSDEYGKWIKVVRADEEEITIYFTENAEVSAGEYSINNKDIRYFMIDVDEPDEDKYVFIKMENSAEIKVAVAKLEDFNNTARIINNSSEVFSDMNNIIESEMINLGDMM